MTPNFALSFSTDGIRLLHRVPGGWHLAGEVPFESDDLAAELAVLRRTALALEPQGLRCKLLLPNDQIKYIAIDRTTTTDGDIQQALEGATPYAIADLVYDQSRGGGRTYVAAVARETLTEAEAFAKEHKFSPVSFAAVPEPFTFVGEAFFGAASAATTEVARDNEPVVVIGAAVLPEPEPVAEDAPVSEVVPEPEETTEPEPTEDPTPVSDDSKSEPELTAETSEDLPDLLFASRARPNLQDAPEIPSDAPAPAVKFEGATPVFSSRTRSEDAAPVSPPVVSPVISPTKETAITAVATPIAPKATAKLADDEKARLTVFGARKPSSKPPVGGKPKYLGLILTVVLILFLAAAAIWASLGSDTLSRWFSDDAAVSDPTDTAALDQPAIPENELAADGTDPTALSPEEIAEAGLNTPEAEGEAEVLLEQPDLPIVSTSGIPRILTPAEAERRYAETGVWQRAARLPLLPRTENTDGIFFAAIDQVTVGTDAVALPAAGLVSPDLALRSPLSPPPAGSRFLRDDRGFILATPEGTVLPDGLIVYAGRPAVVPPARPTIELPVANLDAAAISDAPEEPVGPTPEEIALASVRPQSRPENLSEQIERGGLGGYTASELAAFRPKTRPEGLVPEISAADQAAIAGALAGVAGSIVDATPLAVAASLRPDSRPRNFDRVVASARANAANATPAVATSPVISSGPTPGGVARAATDENVLAMRKVSLVGIVGASNSRAALVRLATGRIVKVSVGDRLDGGQVTAISDKALNYVKRGRTVTLEMPRG